MTTPAPLATLALLAAIPSAQEPFRVGLNMIRFDPAGTGSFDEVDEIFADAALLGAGGLRQFTSHDLSWWHIYLGGDYDDPSSYDFADADLAVWNAHGQSVIPTLFQVGGTSASMAGAPDHKALYTPDGELLDVGQPAIEAKVRGYVRVVAERYQGTVEHWEVANEVGGYSSYSADLYAALLVVVADELRAVDPANQVVVAGLAGTVAPVLSNHIAWFDQVLSAGAGGAIDVVNAHFYDRYELLPAGLDELEVVLAAHGLGDRPLWLTELGSSYIPSDVVPHTTDGSEQDQARDVFRKLCVAFGRGAELALWHTFKSSSESPGYTWSGFGLRKSNGAPALSWQTYQLLAEHLGQFESCTTLSEGAGGVWAYRFDVESGGRPSARWVLWGTAGTPAPDLLVDLASVRATGVVPDSTGSFPVQITDPAALVLDETPLLVEPACDPAQGDCDGDLYGDECQLAFEPAADLSGDGILDLCQGLSADVAGISIGEGGAQHLALHVDPTVGGALYLILGTATGTSPGIAVDGVGLPLNPDTYTSLALSNLSGPVYQGFLGFLSGGGASSAAIDLGAVSIPPSAAGLQLHHAAVVFGPGGAVALASNAVSLELLP